MNKLFCPSLIKLCVFWLLALNANAVFAQQVLTYSYDALGRLIVATDNVNDTRNFDYDAAGNRTNVFIGLPTAPAAPKFSDLSCVAIPNINDRYTASWKKVPTATSYVVTSNSGSVTTSALTTPVLGACLSIKACNKVGCSNTVSFTPVNPLPSPPGAPSISNISGSSATANWSASASTVSGYEYTLNGGTSWIPVGNALSASLTGLASNTAYTFTVRARNAAGASGTSSVNFTAGIAPPGVPSGLSCTPIPNVSNRCTANWTLVPTATSYTITSDAETKTVSAPTVVILGLSRNIKACNSGGCSAPVNF